QKIFLIVQKKLYFCTAYVTSMIMKEKINNLLQEIQSLQPKSKEELENLKKVSEPKFESEFIKVVSMEKVGSLEQKICWADSKRKEVITKEICNKGYEERI
ncbi:MAG: hypothetical protein IJ274_07555, partial [Lachnospiraceae bacterium]|nr:hypothetical protein [Lachnospiraceae bacterium]